jgi:hypothetical protein
MKYKKSTLDFVLKKINKHEIAFNIGLRSFFFCLLYGNVRSISPKNLKAVLASHMELSPVPQPIFKSLQLRIGFSVTPSFDNHIKDLLEFNL